MRRVFDLRSRWSLARIALWLLTIATVAFIMSRSMRGKTASNGESQWVTELLRRLLHNDSISHGFVRKLAHFVEFFVLGVELSALCWLERRTSAQAYVNAWFAGLLTALGDETVQIFSQRGSQVQDVWLDTAGMTCGLLILLAIRVWIGKWKQNKRQ